MDGSGFAEKAGEDHIVPLSDAALAILEAMKEIRRNDFIFPSPQRRQTKTGLGQAALWQLFRRLGYVENVHGMRSAFRKWAADQGIAGEIAERALAHTPPGGKTEGAYLRDGGLPPRRALMDEWAAHLMPPPEPIAAEKWPGLRVA